ncbi:MAG: FMN-binding negative transcriptional regulator [Bacteroidetes bacterium]|nr:FMN-binding negative transcriptional regulator [Bacteroidota bacterium]MCB0842401.1 FMN-binding negative transcriptional regulator [Bacteroidota bacterium]
MYIPRLYQESDQNHILNFIRENSFATLICSQGGIPIATHIPLKLKQSDENLVLIGHVAKPNPIAEAFDETSEILAIFHGPHTYISSSWYDHINVPTWNYQAVHVYGKARKLTSEESSEALIELVHTYEKNVKDGLDWENLPPEVVGSLKGIIGFEIMVEKIEAKSKLSQNRKDSDYFNIISQLKKSGHPMDNEVAIEMEKRREKPNSSP